MSSTRPLSQRYMRALAHVPLLSMRDPGPYSSSASASVIRHRPPRSTRRFERVEVADSRVASSITADYFKDAKSGRAAQPSAVGYINDGRQHLQMQPRGSYDLITPRAAADRVCRSKRALFKGVLRAGAFPLDRGRLRQPVAAGISGAHRDRTRDGPRVRGRISAVSFAVGRRVRSDSAGDQRPAYRDRSRAGVGGARERRRPCRRISRASTSDAFTKSSAGSSALRGPSPTPRARWSR